LGNDSNLNVCLQALSMKVYYAIQDFKAIDNAVDSLTAPVASTIAVDSVASGSID
jgi:hypothetical protein